MTPHTDWKEKSRSLGYGEDMIDAIDSILLSQREQLFNLGYYAAVTDAIKMAIEYREKGFEIQTLIEHLPTLKVDIVSTDK